MILDFDKAVKAKDFTGFYEKTSELWKKEIDAAKLQAAFQSFIDRKSRTSSAKRETAPRFEGRRRIESGLLVVKGNYRNPKSRLSSPSNTPKNTPSGSSPGFG